MGQPGAVALFADGPLGPCRMGRASPGDRAPGLPAADLPAGVDRCRNALAGGDGEGRRVYRRANGRRHLPRPVDAGARSEEHTSELQSLMRTSYAVLVWQKKKT